MDKQDANRLKELEKRVKKRLLTEGSGHDWTHIQRVTSTATHLCEKEEADLFIVTASALLHDLIDDKVVESEEEGRKELSAWMTELGIDDTRQQKVFSVITTISYKGGTGKKVTSLEAEIVQDADRLDAIGAVGIARCFLYAGSKGHVLYDDSIPVRDKMSLSDYRNAPTPALNHFYEKLLKLKELMNTSAGREEAEKRHLFMEQFLNEFYREIGKND